MTGSSKEAQARDVAGVVHLLDGAVRLSTTDFAVGGFGLPWGQGEVWTNELGLALNRSFGNNVSISQLPHLIQATSAVLAVFGGNAICFDLMPDGTYWPRFNAQETLVENGDGSFTLTDSLGERIEFKAFDVAEEDDPTYLMYQRGAFVSFTAADGVSIAVTEYTDFGNIKTLVRGLESFIYDYGSPRRFTDGDIGELLQSVRVVRGTETIYSSTYEYYQDGDALGGDGDLKLVSVYQGGALVDEKRFGYWADGPAGVGRHALWYYLDGDAVARLNGRSCASYGVYATVALSYDGQGRVESQTIRGAGASSPGNLSAAGTFGYSYEDNGGGLGINTPAFYVEMADPGGNVTGYLLDYAGLPTSVQFMDRKDANTALVGRNFDTWYVYDASGRLTETTTPGGVRTVTEYYQGDDGGPWGYVASTALVRPDGLEALQSSMTYWEILAGDVTLHPVQSITAYPYETNLLGDSGGRITKFDYEYDGTRLASVRTELPYVSAAENGSGTAETWAYYDEFGRLAAAYDGDGFGRFYEYDDATGAVTWAATELGPTGDYIITRTEVDQYGRAKVFTDGNGDETHYYYDNDVATRQVVTVPEAGPMTIVTHNRAAGTILTQSGPAEGAGDDVDLALLTSHSAQKLDYAGRVVQSIRFPDMSNLGAQYVTSYEYDGEGRLCQTTDALGTIRKTTYDSLGRVYTLAGGMNPNALAVTEWRIYDNSIRPVNRAPDRGRRRHGCCCVP